MRALRIGRIPFLVCAPFFHRSYDPMPPGIPPLHFQDGTPAALNRLLQDGSIDGAPSSCFEYARNPERYFLLPDISTSSRAEMKSVLLLSRKPWEELDAKPVALSPASATSNALFQLLSRHRRSVRPAPVAPGMTPLAGVYIGDEALRQAASGAWAYRYDLGAEWHAWQGLPFSFGIWMVRREAAEPLSRMESLCDFLKKSVQSFLDEPAAALRKWVERNPTGIPFEEMLRFYQTADYRLTADHRESLHRFFDLLRREGLIEKPAPLRFLALPGSPS